MNRDSTKDGPDTMWRYAPLLPVRNPSSIVSLGEGMTPLIRTRRLGFENLWIKDEGLNPTGSYEARGASCAVSMAVELGVRELAGASPALAAYAAAAGIQAHTPSAAIECRLFGSVPIRDRQAAALPNPPCWIEGEKTLGYELAEQLAWELPDVILSPTGAAAMRTAFDEMEALGWIGPNRPKIIGPPAAALRDMLDAGLELASSEGIFAAPEAAACMIAMKRMLAGGSLRPEERIVICNPAAGWKYLEAYARRLPRTTESEQDKLGGLITPR